MLRAELLMILSWLKCDSDGHMLCPVLSVQLLSPALACAEGEELLERKCGTLVAGIALDLNGRAMSLSAVSMPAFEPLTEPPSWSCPLPLEEQQESCDITRSFFKKENGKGIYLESSSAYVHIREVSEPV